MSNISLNEIKIEGTSRTLSIWFIPGCIYLASFLLCISISVFLAPDSWIIYFCICFILLIYNCKLLFTLKKDGPLRLFTDPILILIFTFSVFYLFGSLFVVFSDMSYHELSSYPVNPQEAFYITSINLLGMGILLLTVSIFNGKFFDRLASPIFNYTTQIKPNKVFFIFFIIGFISSGYVYQFDLNSNRGDVLSASIRMLSLLINVAVVVGVLYRGRYERVYRLVAIVISLLSSFMGLVLFNKSATLIALVILTLSYYFRTKKKSILFIGASLVVVILIVLSKPVLEARSKIELVSNKTVAVRIAILFSSFNILENTEDSKNSTWARLSYLPAQNLAVNYYDAGEGENNLDFILWGFIPRFLYPDKPLISSSGRKFNEKVKGSDTSSLGMGVFVQGYYNAGFYGVGLFSLIGGFMLSFLTSISKAVIKNGAMLLIPLSQLGNYMAYRIDGSFYSDWVGPFSGLVILIILPCYFIPSKNKNYN